MIEFKTIFPSLGHFEECLGLLTCDKHAWLHEQGCNFSVAKTAVQGCVCGKNILQMWEPLESHACFQARYHTYSPVHLQNLQTGHIFAWDIRATILKNEIRRFEAISACFSCRCGSLQRAMHVNKWDIMPTVLWTCGTLKRVSNLRGKAGLPLLSLKMSVSRLFLPVYRQKTHSRSKSL